MVLSATPTWLPDGTFIDESLLDDLSGRLETLLASAERPAIQAAIDPALHEAVKRLAEPHEAGGQERPGNGVALRWLRRVDALAEQSRLWRLPYGNPDLARADASGQLHQVLAWARDAIPANLHGLASVAILDDGASNDLIARLGEFHTVVIRNSTGASPGPPRLISAAPQGLTTRMAGRARQAQRVAEELLADRPPLDLIETEEAANADADLGPLRTRVAPTAEPAAPLRWADAPAPGPWPDVAAALDVATRNATFIADLSGTAPAGQSRIGAMAYSKDFPDEVTATRYIRSVGQPSLDTSLVTLRAAQQFVMGGRTNNFPATVTNGLTIPVTLRLSFASESPQRITVGDTDLITIPAGESATVEIQPRAMSNGVSLVHAQMVTANGTRVGTPVPVEITATDLGRVGWIIIVVSGAVVVGGTAWRIRAVRRQRAKEERESGQ